LERNVAGIRREKYVALLKDIIIKFGDQRKGYGDYVDRKMF